VFAKRMGVHEDEVELPPRVTDFASPECAVVNGSPEEVVDRIGAFTSLVSIDRFTIQSDYGGQPWPLVMRSLDLFGGVMDQVRAMQPAPADAQA
jgi:uncharacterized protein YlzI (FlbEa/FlbD family)